MASPATPRRCRGASSARLPEKDGDRPGPSMSTPGIIANRGPAASAAPLALTPGPARSKIGPSDNAANPEPPMFTSEPSPPKRIELLIEQTPIVDPHTHIRCDRPNAPDLASLMGYHWVQTELRAVGMPAADLDP